MIPALTQSPHVNTVTLAFTKALDEIGFKGDIVTDYASCLTMATDNSIYQILPQAIVFPVSTHDVVLLMQLAQKPVFQSISFVGRGGGTGTNGQSLNQGIVIDFSRHMNHILELNLKEGWVRVEAGVIKDQLNQFLEPHDYFFAPELSTSNRATIGGMISTDASGQGSRVYGKTSNHLKGLTSVLYNGDILHTQSTRLDNISQIASENPSLQALYHSVFQYVHENTALIDEKYPALTRFFTGYDLKHVLSDDHKSIDLSRLIAGSEGTLALVTEAKLNITRLPKYRCLININYRTFDDALRHANDLLKMPVLSIETVDSLVLNLAREDIIWHSVKNLVCADDCDEMQGINIVEFAGQSHVEIDEYVQDLICLLDTAMDAQQNGVMGYQICQHLYDIERVYEMRKKAVGLLGNTKGTAKPIPFVEDTAVPPENLADYIHEFRQILDSHQLKYGMFGHVDVGVLHVRPMLDMNDPEQAKKIKIITEQLVTLTQKYGGLLWGEHGKGVRSQYNLAYLGDELYTLFRQIKTVFDPENRFNPGKICSPIAQDDALYQIDAHFRGEWDRQIPIALRQQYQGAFSCNGNGLCFQFDVDNVICPSMQVSRDRRYSPKGRAVLLREWLRLISVQNEHLDLEKETLYARFSSFFDFIVKWKTTIEMKKGKYDFSHEVKQALSTCLSCKACATQCPVKIDIPTLKAQFLALYHTRYLRPLKDHIIGRVETLMPLLGKFAHWTNSLLAQPILQDLSKQFLGIVDLPLLSEPTLRERIRHIPSIYLNRRELEILPQEKRKDYVFILQDVFTTYYDANVVNDFIEFILRIGLKPILVDFKPNGKGLYIKGFLKQFKKIAHASAKQLNELTKLNIPIIGIEPAIVQSYRDEYVHMLQEKRGDFTILFIQEWLHQEIARLPQKPQINVKRWYLLEHCTEKTAFPTSFQLWQTLFRRLGNELNMVRTGCCGMAGMYGHELENKQTSQQLYFLSWERALRKYPPARCLSTGYSCRSQVKRFENYVLKHPIQALLTLLKE